MVLLDDIDDGIVQLVLDCEIDAVLDVRHDDENAHARG